MLSLQDVLQATGGRLLFKGAEAFSGVSIDSRSIRDGELFFALRGARFDGHDFLSEALQRGLGAVVSIPPLEPLRGKSIIHVGNTLRALQALARYLRLQYPEMPVVGITGSNGKTTTKEMAALVLSARFRVLKSSGNLNNHIGLPLNLTALTQEHQVAVLEMGASAPGDIQELCQIARPTHGVLTCIAQSHLEGFGSIGAILRTKMELSAFVHTLIYNADDPMLREAVKGLRGKHLLSYGLNGAEADVRARHLVLEPWGSRFVLLLEGREAAQVRLQVPGRFNVLNALAAVATGLCFGLAPEEMARALEDFQGVPLRYEVREFQGATLLSDVYNANPGSMEEALKELVRLRRSRAVAVLGDMLELGSYAPSAHQRLGAWMRTLPVELFIAVGPLMAQAAQEFARDGRRAICVKDALEAKKVLMEHFRAGDTILVKGSRGMHMERILEGGHAV